MLKRSKNNIQTDVFIYYVFFFKLTVFNYVIHADSVFSQKLLSYTTKNTFLRGLDVFLLETVLVNLV